MHAVSPRVMVRAWLYSVGSGGIARHRACRPLALGQELERLRQRLYKLHDEAAQLEGEQHAAPHCCVAGCTAAD